MKLLNVLGVGCLVALFVGGIQGPGAPPLLNQVVVRAVAELTINNETTTSTGSAVIIDSIKKGDNKYELLLLTAKHVATLVEDPKYQGSKLFIEFCGNGEEPLKRYQVDKIFDHPTPESDVSILSVISETNYSPVKMNSNPFTPELEVLSAGYSCGFGLSVCEGYLTFKSKETDKGWVTSAPAYFGNSGGGIFDKKTRELIGITNRVMVSDSLGFPGAVTHLHFFMPIFQIKDWIKGVCDERNK